MKKTEKREKLRAVYRYFSNRKGITLIALIITILVMLILAGVAISMVVGDNGVIERAEEIKSAMEQSEIEDIIKTSHYYDTENIGKLEFNNTSEAIRKNLENSGYTNVKIEGKDDGKGGKTFPITVEATGKTGTYTYIINGNGNIKKITNQNDFELSYEKITNSKIILKIGNGFDKEAAIIQKINENGIVCENIEQALNLMLEEITGTDVSLTKQEVINTMYQMLYGVLPEENVDVESQIISILAIYVADEILVNEEIYSFETYMQELGVLIEPSAKNVIKVTIGEMITEIVINELEIDELAELRRFFSSDEIENIENLEDNLKIENELLSYPLYILTFSAGMNVNEEEQEGNIHFDICIKYGNKIWKVIYNVENKDGQEIVEVDIVQLYNIDEEINEYEGTFVSYDSDNNGSDEIWIVLYNENSKMQLLGLPNQFALADYNGVDLNDDGNIEGSEEKPSDLDESGGATDQVENAVHFYNNIIKVLNDEALSKITETEYKDSVRCLGTDPLTPYKDDSEYGSEYYIHDASSSAKGPNYLFKIKNGDFNYEKDHKKVLCLSIPYLKSQYFENDDPIYYISRHDDFSKGIWGTVFGWLGLRTSIETGSALGAQMIIKSEYLNVHTPKAVENIVYYPVVTLKEGVKIDTSSGSGSLDSPYKLKK